MTEKQKMIAGELYNADDPELVAGRETAQRWMDEYNQGSGADTESQARLLRTCLGHAGDGATVRAPFYCDYGYNIFLGSGVFLNFNCVLLDVTPIHIGDGTLIGPGVHIYAADHPRDPETRRSGLEGGKPVTVGRNVWIGGGAILLPGVTIADDAIIGAGSVVTRDVAQAATVVGNPARRILPR